MLLRSRKRNDASEAFRNLDWPTVIIYLIMVIAGMISIYAACYNFDNASMLSADEFSGKQLRWIGLSLVLGFILLCMSLCSGRILLCCLSGLLILVLLMVRDGRMI